MRIQLSVLAASMVLLSLAAPVRAEKARAWLTGKVVDSERSRYLAGTRGRVDEYTPGGGYSERAVYRQIATFVIEGSEYAYFVQEDTGRPHLGLLPPKPANLTVNAPVKYAVEKQKLFLIDDDGKEHRMDITKRVLIQPKPIASSSERASSERADAEFGLQMQREFPEIIADSARIDQGLPPQSEMFRCASAIYRAAVALDPALKESKSALLMAARQAKAELNTGACAAH